MTETKERPDRNLAMELVRVTEAAALAAGRWVGRGDKLAADGAAVDAMRLMIDSVSMDGVVVIGEGEKDAAPMLFNGEEVGTGDGPGTDVAVDPVDGTTLTAKGMGNALVGHRPRRARLDVLPRPRRLHGEDRDGARGGGRDRHRGAARRELPQGREGAGQERRAGHRDHAGARPAPASHREDPRGRVPDRADHRRRRRRRHRRGRPQLDARPAASASAARRKA